MQLDEQLLLLVLVADEVLGGWSLCVTDSE